MSGGRAFVFDDQGDFTSRRCNKISVDLEPLVTDEDVAEVRGLLERHRDLTGSPRAAWILEHWADAQPQFIKVFPHEFKRVLGVPRVDSVYVSPNNSSPLVTETAEVQHVAPFARTTLRCMCTGDNRRTAESVARELGIDEFRAEVMPDEKIKIVKRLKAGGAIVAMAGDGINDAPALAAADVGIAMGTGTDVAIESASITLVKGDLMGIVKAMHLSRAVMRNIRQNLFFAFIYNALGVPIAAGVLYPFFGILLSPMIAGAAMSFSSVSVIANALRLRRIKL